MTAEGWTRPPLPAPEPSPAGRIRLFVAGERSFETVLLPEAGEVTIGSAAHCDVRIDRPSIAAEHAILRVGETVTLEALAAGARVAERALARGTRVELQPSDTVDIAGVALILEQRPGPAPRRIATHGYFEVRLEEEVPRAQRHGVGFGLLLVQHRGALPAGVVEEALASSLRAFDVVAVDGDVHEILLQDTAPEGVARVVSRLTGDLTACGDDPVIGVACYPRDGRSGEALIAHARAMLRGDAGPPRALPGGYPVSPSGPMQQLLTFIDRVAPSDISVLIHGETGVGKERVAELVHLRSHRAGKPFLCLSCAALTETLLENELFGHERGAFTGAGQAKAGLFETCAGGTVFLDEIGELPLSIQAKLLRVVEERAVRRVGGLKARPIDVRFVAATNRDLDVEVARGLFRPDLFFRLNGVSLFVPPLRERPGEIEELARTFIADASRRADHRAPPVLAAEALELFRSYPWPGNIRELRNVIERAVLLCTGAVITVAELPAEKMRAHFAPRHASARAQPFMRRSAPLSPVAPRPELDAEPARGELSGFTAAELRRALDARERERIVEALARCAGNQTEAARLLGIARRTLVKRLGRYHISRPRKDHGERS